MNEYLNAPHADSCIVLLVKFIAGPERSAELLWMLHCFSIVNVKDHLK